ncbi:serine/threonine-protein kinase [Nocardiopsis sp. CC223A]|uniref:serine/threonine-protein kinase n=1 Tax=Nocardiopsis sp. CC223A TaxID=3044051 RepID=UPI00278BF6CF|nr:serine/threonine-protein kinase [Nocardiopsis sp. CC223A]
MAEPITDGDPTHAGPYKLHARLGGGGMGQVFLGRSPGGRTVVVKVVRPELARDAEFRRRFAAEIAAARRVGGFYTAQVVDAGPEDDPPWLATAYIPGPTLHQAVTDHGPLPVESVAVLGAGLAEGLAAVHASDLVHRDLKPANIILAADGPRLIDFGIARALDATSHTRTSTVLGTAAFMSPEQATARQIGPASDVFSLGCVLAFAATGRSPFGEGPVHAVVFRVVHEEPDLSGLPAPLAGLVGECLAKDPAARPDLEHLLRESSAMAPAEEGRGESRWPSGDLTEVITGYQGLPPTLAETEPDQAGGGLDAGQVRLIPEKSPHRESKEKANLVIGNLGLVPMTAIVDDASMGLIQPGQDHAFSVEPGRHMLLVKTGGPRYLAQRLQLDAGSTTAIAFEGEEQVEPRQVQEVVFTGSRAEKAFEEAVAWGLMVLLIGLLNAWAQEGTGTLPVVMLISLGVSAIAGLIGFMETPSRFIVGSGGLKARKRVWWGEVEKVGITGHGRGARLVLWTKKGRSLNDGILPLAGKQAPDGSYASPVKRIGVRSERDLERLRAALRWFAGDRYLEQSR